MKIEELIFYVLSNSEDLENIFGDNIYPLSGKKNSLPVLLYQVYQYDAEPTKTNKTLKDSYLLKLHIFSEDYLDVVNSVDILKELFDFKELIDDNDNVVIDLVRFDKYSDEYEEKPELFNRTIEFTLHKFFN